MTNEQLAGLLGVILFSSGNIAIAIYLTGRHIVEAIRENKKPEQEPVSRRFEGFVTPHGPEDFH